VPVADDVDHASLGELLARIETSEPAAVVDVVSAHLFERLDARDIGFLIVDLLARSLVRITQRNAPDGGDGPGRVEAVPLSGPGDEAHQQALRTQQMQLEHVAGGVRMVAPVTGRGDAIGVLELVLPYLPDDRTRRYIASVAHTLAYVVMAERRYTDLFEWGQRSTPVSLAAEIQRRLLPGSFTCEAGCFTLSGWLEPADSVGGDTFDYCLNRGRLHLSITDAMGHEVEAALLATLTVASLRNSRRSGEDLADMADRASRALEAHAQAQGDVRFVTGQMISLDLADGRAEIVNAGHPLPLRVRDGTVGHVALEVDLPLGVEPETVYRLQRFALQPGDRLVLLTDGMLERNSAEIDIAAMLVEHRDQHPREIVHTLTRAVVDRHRGPLHDDATVVCLDWYGGGSDREAFAGATRSRASR
jgi:serine phosphatase RsbU (regulator of sigma subunit)